MLAPTQIERTRIERRPSNEAGPDWGESIREIYLNFLGGGKSFRPTFGGFLAARHGSRKISHLLGGIDR